MAAAPARPGIPTRIELSVAEARTRFLQIIRLTPVTRQETVLMDQDRPVAAIVPADTLDDRRDHHPAANANAAGWIERLETVRRNLRQQHAADTAELLQALHEAWKVIDGVRPPGTDKRVDDLRTLHAQLKHRN